jgi:mRNA interferase YafQ
MIEFSKEKTKYKAEFTTRMKKDFKRILKRNYNIEEFVYVVQKLLNGLPLEEKYKDHALEGNWKNHRELHIRPDWLLIYQIKDDVLILELTRTGTHSDLF